MAAEVEGKPFRLSLFPQIKPKPSFLNHYYTNHPSETVIFKKII